MTDHKPSPHTDSHLDDARDAVGRAYERTVDTASATLDQSRETAASAIQSNPLGVLVGGIAVGALVGALLPRSAKERQLLAPLGRQLGERVRLATQAARSAGQSELADLGLTKGAAKDQLRTVLDGVVKAASTAGNAAAKATSTKA